ncbi:MAG TPA: 4-hydroxy-tetrahydrodipicolinate reductase [Bacillota bacterium]|nr:4-hydroxy-tetrahydrodipicolinate reductase [Bacillota bacterium]
MSPNEPIRVVVVGAVGRVGREVVRTIVAQEDMKLVGAVDQAMIGKDAGLVAGLEPLDLPISGDLDGVFKEVHPHVFVDFTTPLTIMSNITAAARHGISGVIGTTGLTTDNLEEIRRMAANGGTNFLVAPNFALGAILMMRFAKEAAAYLPNVEIIELHHDQKMDAPSGTAIKTAEMIAEGRRSAPPVLPQTIEKVKGSRGGEIDSIHIHSIRLPGLVAHQEVIFGGQGQTLSIRHDSMSRESFMPGVLLGIRKVLNRPGLTYGLEHFLD